MALHILFQRVLPWAIQLALFFLLIPPLIRNFEPDNRFNTRTHAFIMALVIVFAGGGVTLMSDHEGGVLWRFPLLLPFLMFKYLYRVSWVLALGVTVLTAVLSFFCFVVLGAGAEMLWMIHPALVWLGALLALSVPVLRWWKDHSLKRRFEAVE